MHFTKWHGLGNDFVIVNGVQTQVVDYAKAAIEVCDRHFGIGADGLVFVLPSDIADFKMKIMNSDGSEAEMCGNVTRCVAKYVYQQGMTNQTKITLETLAGIIKPELLESQDIVKVDMGEPRLNRGLIPMAGPAQEQAVNIPLSIDNQTYYITAVSMGNPHCIIFVDDIAKIVLPEVGPKIETHKIFPQKTNVEFVQVINKQLLRMRVWERGAGITLACGTGSCATLVAAVLNEKTNRQAAIELDGGTLYVEWADNNHIYMSGPAVEVFQGEWESQFIK